MQGTENIRFLCSYLVVLDLYSRVTLYFILVFNQYFTGKLEPIGFCSLVDHRSNRKRYNRHTSEIYTVTLMAIPWIKTGRFISDISATLVTLYTWVINGWLSFTCILLQSEYMFIYGEMILDFNKWQKIRFWW